MLNKTRIENLIPILMKDAKRALQMKLRGFPKPYYCAFLLQDINWFNTWASSGSIYRKRSDRTRNVNCDIRVGSYRYDQITEGGLYDNDDELESVAHITVPIDDKNHDGLRLALWRLSESKFREALTDYSNKESARVSTVDPNRKFSTFAKLKPVKAVKFARPEKIEEEKWVKFCKHASDWLCDVPGLSGNWVEFDTSQETKIFVNTENSVIVQHSQIFSLVAGIRKLTKHGLHIEHELVFNCATQKELPNMRQFKKAAEKKIRQIMAVAEAKKIHSFSGPVLLYSRPSGLLFHEAIGHRLEGSRLLSAGEGSTFKGQIGKKVLNVDLDIYDNPRLKKFKGRRCIGAYDYDDEGTPSDSAVLVEKGKLKGFLNTRAQIPAPGNQLNGHARCKKYQRPISRMGVTVIGASNGNGLSLEELKEKLIEEIIKQNKPFGMIVYDTSGGETDTAVYDFQAFYGEISYATLVYPDGSETCVRGVNFVGTPLQALHNIIAVGAEQEMENHYCGAESGFIPVSTISPPVLLKNLELQAKEEELVTPYLLPRPRL